MMAVGDVKGCVACWGLPANGYLIRESSCRYNLVCLFIPECGPIRLHFCVPPYVRSPISVLPQPSNVTMFYFWGYCSISNMAFSSCPSLGPPFAGGRAS